MTSVDEAICLCKPIVGWQNEYANWKGYDRKRYWLKLSQFTNQAFVWQK